MLPVVLIHGFASSSGDLNYLASFLRRKGFSVHCVRYAEGSSTATATATLDQQMCNLNCAIRQLVQEQSEEFRQGFNIVAHSQGAVLARGAIIKFGLATFCKVNVFVSMAGPHLGLRNITAEMIRLSYELGHPAHADLVKSVMERCAQEVAGGDALMPVRLRSGVLRSFAPIFLYRPMHQEAPAGDFLWDLVEGIGELGGAEENLKAVGEFHFLAGAEDAVVDRASALFEEPKGGFPPLLARLEGRVHRQTVAGLGHADWLSPGSTKAWQDHLEPLLAGAPPVYIAGNQGGALGDKASEPAWQRADSESTAASSASDREASAVGKLEERSRIDSASTAASSSDMPGEVRN